MLPVNGLAIASMIPAWFPMIPMQYAKNMSAVMVIFFVDPL
jgi:hypothetical protein